MNLLSGLVAGALVALLVLTAFVRAQCTQERYVLADLRAQDLLLQRRAGALCVERNGLAAELAARLDPTPPALGTEWDG